MNLNTQKIFVILVIATGVIFPAAYAYSAPQLPDSANIPKAEPLPEFPSIPQPAVDKEESLEFKPALDKNSTVKVTVSRFEFNNNLAFSDEQLSSLLTAYLNRPLDIQGLNQAADTITRHYRTQGFLLAQAYFPEQDINQGIIEISIIEGLLGELKVGVSSRLDDEFLRSMAGNNLAAGDSIREDNLVRNITVLDSLPGLKAAAELSPGEKVGTATATVNLEELPRWNAVLNASTYGNRYTGREVISGAAYLNNLAGRGDQLSFGLTSSRDELQRGVQLGYITPIHVSGMLLSLNYNYVDYRLGGEFSVLDASGDSQYFSALIDQPILRNKQQNLTSRIGISHKDVTDEVEAFLLKSHRNVEAIDFGAYGDWRDQFNGFNQLGLNIRYGYLNFRNGQARIDDSAGAETAGNFIKYNIFASRIQPLFANLHLTLRAEYQGANQNLDSSEKFSIGGVNRWRAFAELPTSADRGLELGVELRGRMSGTRLAQVFIEGLSPYGFFDYGTGTLNQNALSSNNHVESAHYGLGVDIDIVKNWFMGLAVSHQERRIDGNPREDETRAWGHVQKAF